MMTNFETNTSHLNNPLREIQSLTNQQLIRKIDGLAKEGRRITIEILRLLREIERRQLFAELGFPSLFAYCTKVLLYSEAAACRRIEAMRAMRETSEIESKLESGELSLSVVTQARTMIRQHENFSKTKVTAEKRKDVMLALCGQSKREAEKVLATEFATPLPAVPVVQRETARGTTRVTIEFTEDEMKVFEEIRRLSGRPQNLKETVLRLAAKELTQLRKSRGEIRVRAKRSSVESHQSKSQAPENSPIDNSPSTAEVKKEAALPKTSIEDNALAKLNQPTDSRAILIATKRRVWVKAGGRCEFQSVSGQRCEACHELEYDHIVPVCRGGASIEENLRLLCRQHNIHAATQILGGKLMKAYIPAIR